MSAENNPPDFGGQPPESTAEDEFRVREVFEQEFFASLHACDELYYQFRQACREHPAGRWSDVAVSTQQTYIYSQLLESSRFVYERWSQEVWAKKFDFVELAHEAWLLLAQGPPEVQPFDPTVFASPTQYLMYVVRKVMDRFRGKELTRRQTFQPNPYDPDGPPVRSTARRPRTVPLPANVAASSVAEQTDAEIERAEKVEQAEKVKKVVDRGPWNDLEQVILQQYYGKGVSLTALAEQLGQSPAALFKAHQRLKDKLRQRLTED